MQKKHSLFCLLMIICLVFCHSDISYAAMADESIETISEENESIQKMEDENHTVRENKAKLELSAPSVILVEPTTKSVLYEVDSKKRRAPASVTKIMTLLLIFEAIEKGKISLDDEVVISERAMGMGGSQVFLHTGEIQTVETLIKCIAIASGNDSAVAMAEYISGSEEEFVRQMNLKADELGMDNTHYVDCSGLTDSDDHYMSAEDVAKMSIELLIKYPQVCEYTTIWMEDIVHDTPQGISNFTLASTNRLLKQYQWTTGLKTGSTSKAKYCISASATKDDISLIAVVLAAPNSKLRFQDAITLLNYGYSVSRMYHDDNPTQIPIQKIYNGVNETVPLKYENTFSYLDTSGTDLSTIEKKIELPEELVAPVKDGDVAGKVVYYLNGKMIGSINILFAADVDEAKYKDYLKRTWKKYLV